MGVDRAVDARRANDGRTAAAVRPVPNEEIGVDSEIKAVAGCNWRACPRRKGASAPAVASS